MAEGLFMDRWFKRSFWRNLVDMHIPDWNQDFMRGFSPDQYAQNMQVAEVDASELYTGNCLGICFWPTKAGHMHEGLQGKDIVGPTLGLLQEKSMFTLAYFNIWSRWAFDTHPHWRLVRANGTHTTRNVDGSTSRYGQCCLNSPGYRNYVKLQMEDLAGRYAFDGAWIDMLGWFGTICCCPDCRARYYEETGQEIPETVNWFDPEWVRFQRSREKWMTDFAVMVRSTLQAVKPGVSVVFNCGSWQSGWMGGCSQAFLDQSDYLAGDFYGNALMYTTFCKFLNNATMNRPIEFMTSRCIDLHDHTTTKTRAELKYTASGSFAHNGAFTFIDAINPDGTMNPQLYRDMGSLHRELKKYQDALSPDAVMLRDVSFLFNFESFIDLRSNGISLRKLADGHVVFAETSGSPRLKMMQIAKAMISDHLAFDLTCLKKIAEAEQNSQVLVIPNQYVLLAEELAALESFLEQGGSVLITGQSGIVDKDGHKLPDFAHADLSGVHLQGVTDEDVTYLRPMPEAPELFGDYDQKYPLSIDRHSTLIKADDDVDVLARLTLPWSHSREIHRFGSAISNPPGLDTDYPAVTLRHHKKGKVMYLSVPLEEITFAAQQRIFAGLLRYLMPENSLIKTNAPAWLEWLVYADPQKNRYLIYAMKAMETYYEMSARDVTIALRLPDQQGELQDITTGRSVSWHRDHDYVCWQATEINDFAMYIFTVT